MAPDTSRLDDPGRLDPAQAGGVLATAILAALIA
jgi:hypothetical protein